ncbi:MAG: hypothetical protein EXS00_01905 [Phycisphaerales bacterium]|nr:hypothetical protein [Phycisphaerales bacterium]
MPLGSCYLALALLHGALTSQAIIPPNLLIPLPTRGAVSPMYQQEEGLWFPTEGAKPQEIVEGAARRLARTVLSPTHKADPAKAASVLAAFTDQSGFQTLYESLAPAGQNAASALITHFATQGSGGQAALAWMSLEDTDPAVRHSASRSIRQPLCNAVLATIDGALRSTNHQRVNRAGLLAGQLQATAAIPLLIFAQFARDDLPNTGDLAWIAIGTTTSYVANLIPILGDGSGAFAPVIGQVTEGVVMRVQDAVVYTARADVHTSLIALSSYDWGHDTGYLAWDMPTWAVWFNTQYVPFKQAQAAAPPPVSAAAVP